VQGSHHDATSNRHAFTPTAAPPNVRTGTKLHTAPSRRKLEVVGAPGPKRVFVMDDSAFALDLVRTALDDAGFVVSCGRDLTDLSRVDGKPFDLILMDVEMPEAFGDDLVSCLRAEGLKTPVYLLSALPDDRLAQRAAECSAQGFISKRGGVDGVIAQVRAILHSPGTDPSLAPTLLIEAFLSMARGRLRRADAAIEQGDPSLVVRELHTLTGEAALLGLDDVARDAEAARALAAATVGGVAARADAVSLRAALAVVEAGLDGAAPRARIPTSPAAGRSGRILLLDDSDFYRSTLMAVLEDAGHVVVEARRLSEARHRMHEGHYDLAILDLQLEDGHGSDLIPDLRKHASGTRLLILSGDVSGAHDAADLVLPKSLDPAELLRRIDEVLAAGSPR
jgi:DNA-binding response OmpR family regulator